MAGHTSVSGHWPITDEAHSKFLQKRRLYLGFIKENIPTVLEYISTRNRDYKYICGKPNVSKNSNMKCLLRNRKM